MKYFPCLLALALLALSLQACGSDSAKSGANAQPDAQNQTPRPDSQQASETVVPAPSEFKKDFAGVIGDNRAVRMELERKGDDLTGGYFYERAGAFNSATRTLELKGRIDGDGNVALTETSYETGNPRKTGEFKGRLDGLSANGEVSLRFSGSWTGGKGGKQATFNLREIRFDLGGLKLDRKEEKVKDKKLGYEIETAMPQLAGADSARVENFNQAVGKLIAEVKDEFEETARASARGDDPGVQNYNLSVDYEIIDAGKDFISVLFSFNSYLGGAHPNANARSFNYDLNRGAPVSLADLFIPGSNYLNVISDYSIRELNKLKTTAQVEIGAGPQIGNFHSWNITPFGLRITFDAYQVGPYAAGEHVVVIPYPLLKPIIRPDGLLTRFAK